MRRSKLEMYLATLEALANYGPMKLTRITCKANLNCGSLKRILKDLIEKDLVEERKPKKNIVVYAATPKARTILACFKELSKIIPMKDESAIERASMFYTEDYQMTIVQELEQDSFSFENEE
jgi:predicted transcriptional regulator